MTPGMTENTGQDAESPMQVEHFLLYGEERLPFRLVRRGTARGSIRIAVTPQGEILVTADAATSLEAVEDVLQQRVRWLLETRERFQAQRAHALPRRFVGGETHFYLGRRHQLRIVDESEGKHVRLLRGRLVVPSRYPWSEEPAVLASRTEEIRRRLEAWYRQRAEEVLPQYFAAGPLGGQAASAPGAHEGPLGQLHVAGCRPAQSRPGTRTTSLHRVCDPA